MKSNILKRFKLCGALLLLLPFATTAVAEDFTFTVPYSFHGVEDGSLSTIRCDVFGAFNDVLIGRFARDYLHPNTGNPDRLHNGSNIPVTLNFNASPGKDASMAKRYVCYIFAYRSSNRNSRFDPSRTVQQVYGAITHSAPLSIPVPPHSPIR